ncbi:MAG: CoA pyrophosphatase [Bacteroidetes bacterium]|nr:CoA pyrophosphatase [Bacteroidota bacterium]
MIFLDRFSNELQKLPGIEAHKKFYPLRFEHIEKPDEVKLSAVGVHLFKKETEIYFILIERSEYEGHHSKQIAFPGGKKELFDKDLEETARRESIEEINIAMNQARLIGQITPVYIPVSNFEVYPYLYWHEEVPKYDLSSREVNDIFIVNCSDLLNDDNLTEIDIEISKNSKLKNVPCFRLQDKIVWGATALILSEIRELLKRL